MKNKHIAVVDLGSQSIGASIGKLENGETEIIGSEVVPSKGIEKGIIKDSSKVKEAVDEVLAKIWTNYYEKFEDIYLGVSNYGLRIVESWGTINLKNGKVSSNDIKRAINKGQRNSTIFEDEGIVDIIINYYKVDGKVNYENVVGWIGSTLELNLTLVIGSRKLIDEYRRLVDSKYNLKGIFCNSISSKNLLLTGKNLVGTRVLVDCGASTTDISIFKNGIIKYIGQIPLGGNNITRDLSVCGKFTISEAENIKKVYSAHYDSFLKEDENNIEIGATVVSKDLFSEVCKARIEEMIKYIKVELKKYSHYEDICSIIIYGEALAYFENIDKIAKLSLSENSRFITREKLGLSSSDKTVALALLKEGLDREKIFNSVDIPNLHKDIKVEKEIKSESEEEVIEGSFIKRVKGFLREIF